VSAKPHVRPLARSDVEHAIEYYGSDAGVAVAERFVDALERAYEDVVIYPRMGSHRYFRHPLLKRVRCRPIAGFPYLVFYIDNDGSVDVLRVLHERRDVKALDLQVH
jgi:toxin ParE1/3/4